MKYKDSSRREMTSNTASDYSIKFQSALIYFIHHISGETNDRLCPALGPFQRLPISRIKRVQSCCRRLQEAGCRAGKVLQEQTEQNRCKDKNQRPGCLSRKSHRSDQ